MSKEILKALVSFREDGMTHNFDVIDHNGHLWLVSRWLESTDKRWISPERIILLDNLSPQRMEDGHPADFLVSVELHKRVFDGEAPPDGEIAYEIQDLPEIVFDNPEL